MKKLRAPGYQRSITALFTLCMIFMISCSNPDMVTGQIPGIQGTQAVSTSPTGPPTGKKIQLALLLDTSNSMDGLIEQAKSTLWKFVNALSKTQNQGQKPELDIALYEYGNDGLSENTGYVRQVSAFTGELDEISEKLFSLHTNGGSEYCGKVIGVSLEELLWTNASDDLKIIFIAGNEPFDQGPVNFQKSCGLAKEKNVIINTIFCGEFEEGRRTYWQSGAISANGNYMAIDHNSQTVYTETPYDNAIDSLNTLMNQTYIYYGKDGYTKFEKQQKQDDNSEVYGKANKVERSVSKASSFYSNKSWDLIDASSEKSFDISKIKNSELPVTMQQMSDAEKIHFIEKNKNDRMAIKTQINEINALRSEYIVKNSGQDNDKSLDAAMLSAIKKQATDKGFEIQ